MAINLKIFHILSGGEAVGNNNLKLIQLLLSSGCNALPANCWVLTDDLDLWLSLLLFFVITLY